LQGPQHPVNSYVYQGPKGVVLVDPTGDLTSDILRSNGIDVVDAILITHIQEEHIAGVTNFPGTPLYVAAGDEYLCEGRDAYIARDTTWQPPWDWETRGNYQGHLAGARNERPTHERLELAGVLRDGDTIFGCCVLASPGHGKNALSFVSELEGRRITFCGDLIYEHGQLWNWFDCDWDYGLQNGQKALLASARTLLSTRCDVLLSSHGEPIFEPQSALNLLVAHLEQVLHEEPEDPSPINFPERDSPANGWRELSPHLHQWRSGNCAVLTSCSGNALLVDDGLCYWQPEPTRSAHHDEVIQNLKSSLNIHRIEVCIPTHYHGDHIENIPALVENEETQVISLDVVADVIEYPGRFNLSATLPWYGTPHNTVPIHRRVVSGTKIRWHEYEIELFHLGGQTYYHAGLSIEVDGQRVLFVGDAIYGWNPTPEPIITYNDCEPQKRGWVYALERMIERAPELLVCGHGSAVRDPMPLLRSKRSRWQKRLREYSALDARCNSRRFFDPFAGTMISKESQHLNQEIALIKDKTGDNLSPRKGWSVEKLDAEEGGRRHGHDGPEKGDGEFAED